MNVTKGYTFDDLLLVPKHSTIPSRSKVDLSVKLPRGFSLKLPFVSAPMKTVSGPKMVNTLASLGCMGLLHRFDNDVLAEFLQDNKKPESLSGLIGASVGIKQPDFLLAKNLIYCECKVLCVDVAHGDHSMVIEFIKKLRELSGEVLIITGNVATAEGAERLWEAGADLVRSGIGGGSVCSTRIETGNGYPQMSLLDNVFSHRTCLDNKIISDGGIRSAGDCAKALAFADLVMIGNMFAGTDEAPGEIVELNGIKYKQYAGSSTYKGKHVEGVVGLVPYRGPVSGIVERLADGLQSSCSYQGVLNLVDFKKNPEFVQITNAGLIESHPHDVLKR
jgi:IMP dehydrogenase